MQNGEKLPKRKISADLELSDGTRLKAKLFVSPQGRVLDMLNDGRAFLPLETDSGEVVFLHKNAIRRVAPVPETNQDRTAGRAEAASDDARPGASVTDPYELLGVSRECSAEEMREAYRQRCRENHPDRLQALGLPRDYVALATRRMAEINAAYDRLRQARQFR